MSQYLRVVSVMTDTYTQNSVLKLKARVCHAPTITVKRPVAISVRVEFYQDPPASGHNSCLNIFVYSIQLHIEKCIYKRLGEPHTES